MKNPFISICFFLLLLPNILEAQTWQPLGPDDSRQPSGGTVNYVSLALDKSGTPYVAFMGNSSTGGSPSPRVKKFNGVDWDYVGGTAPINPLGAEWTDIDLDTNDVPYLIYCQYGTSVKKFDGSSWVNVGPGLLSFAGTAHTRIIVDKLSNIPYAAYWDYDTGITVKKFDGNNWTLVGNAGFNPANTSKEELGFAIDNAGVPYVALRNAAAPGKVSVMKFDGTNWVFVGAQGFSDGKAESISIVLNSSGIPFVAYRDGAHANKVTVKMLSGNNWITVGSAGFSPTEAYSTNIKVNSAGELYVSFKKLNSYPGNLTVEKFDGVSWVDVSDNSLAREYVSSLALAIDKTDHPLLAAMDQNIGFVHVKKLTNAWNDVGRVGITEAPALFADLKLDSAERPYIICRDEARGNKATLKIFNGLEWVYLGDTGISAGSAFSPALAIWNTTPYAIYVDQAAGSKASVKKYDGANWVYVGLQGFSADYIADPSIAFDPYGTPYISYVRGIDQNPVVQKFDGSSWIDVGDTAFLATGGKFQFTTVAADSLGNVYLCADTKLGAKLRVFKYDGAAWSFVGGPWVSTDPAQYSSFAIGPGGSPYVAYKGYGSSYHQIIVRKFNGSAWTYVGAGIDSDFPKGNLTFGKSGVPYLAYPDTGAKLSVRKFDGNSWIYAGNSRFSFANISLGSATRCAIAVSSDSIYTAYCSIFNGADDGPVYSKVFTLQSASISTNATAVCPNTLISFTATTKGISPPISYQWKKNGINVGNNSAVYSNSNLSPTDQISCVVMGGNDTITTNTITLPAFQASLSGNPCSGVPLNITANSSPLSSAWSINGSVIRTTYSNWSSGTTIAGAHGAGSALNQLIDPSGIFVTQRSSDMYVADQGNNRIVKYGPGDNTGTVVAGGNGSGAAANQLNAPSGVWIKGTDLYIADQGNNRVQKWTLGQTSGITVAGGNGAGTAANQLNSPAAVYVSSADDIYIADQNNNRVQKWTAGASSGTTVAGVAAGTGGSNLSKLSHPAALFVETNGDIYVADQFNNRIVKWAPGGTAGTLVAGGNGPGPALNQLYRPSSVIRDVVGNTYIVDMLNYRVVRWGPGASSGVLVAGGIGPVGGPNGLKRPAALCMDSKGGLYVTDQANLRRVQRYDPISNTSMSAYAEGTYSALVTDFKGCTASATPSQNVSSSGFANAGTSAGVLPDGATLSYINGSCKILVTMADAPAGNNPDTVAVNAFKDLAVQTYNNRPYLQKHIDIQPKNNGAATVTLYVQQADFTAYNNYVTSNGLSYPLLPSSGSNTAGAANIVITQYLGKPSANTTGPGGQYDATQKVLIPNSSITRSYSTGYWTLTFPVTTLSGGFFIHSGATALKETNATIVAPTGDAFTISAYPNPATDVVNVSISGTRSEDARIEITDMTGKKLLSAEMPGEQRAVNISRLAPGMYMLRYTDRDRSSVTKITKL